MKFCSLFLVLTVVAFPAALAANSYDGYKVPCGSNSQCT